MNDISEKQATAGTPASVTRVAPSGDGDALDQALRHAAAAHRAGRLAEAVQGYGRVLRTRPYSAELHNNVGVALRSMGKLESAIAHYRTALALEPHNPALHSNLGNALRGANRLDEALEHQIQAVRLDENHLEGFHNLGVNLRELGRIDEALACFYRVLQLHPQEVRAQVEIATTRLMRGELEQGFADYEARKLMPDYHAPDLKQPEWRGEDLTGLTLLIYPEQGLSEALMFARFIPMLRQRGARVVMLCQPLLRDLFRLMPEIDSVVAEGEPLPGYDLHIAMLSLPHRLGVQATTIPVPVPYLNAPPRARIGLGSLPRTKLKVGIFWAAMPGQLADRQRSIGLEHFLALVDSPEILFFSLQGGAPQKDLDRLEAHTVLPDVGRGIFDFAEAASVLTQIDLLVTIDAPIAHLAGGMGVPVWTLVPYVADWRWMIGRSDSPWYPSMRLFRQPAPGDWQAVFKAVHEALHGLLAAVSQTADSPAQA